MNFDNSFTVAAPLELVWRQLLDVEGVAPCVPGATLTERVSENEYRGTVKVKLGAIQVNYSGTALVRHADEATRTIVIDARGADPRTGTAAATLTSVLSAAGAGQTLITINSEVTITGRVTQFGRGIMQDVAASLIRRFAECLEGKIGLAQSSAEGESSHDQAASGDPAEIKLGPILVEAGRTRVAKGVRALGKIGKRAE